MVVGSFDGPFDGPFDGLHGNVGHKLVDILEFARRKSVLFIRVDELVMKKAFPPDRGISWHELSLYGVL